jgi:hypothetical protein
MRPTHNGKPFTDQEWFECEWVLHQRWAIYPHRSREDYRRTHPVFSKMDIK